MKVAVIGSSGGMGRFFADYFLSQGHHVIGYDLKRTNIRDANFDPAESSQRAVEGAEVVLIATPIDATVETVREIAPGLGAGTCVIDLASLKGKVIPELRLALKKSGAVHLSLHPLFGPSLSASATMKICVVDAGKKAQALAEKLFPDATLIPIGAEEHDKAMGVILSLTHLLNIAYASAVAKNLSPKDFRRMESPTSAVQLSLAEAVLNQSPALYSYIQLENEFSAKLASDLIESLTELKGIIDRKDRRAFEKLFSDLAKLYAEDSKTALESVYEAFEVKQSR